MATFSRLRKLALVSLGAIGGGLAYYRMNKDEHVSTFNVLNSWTTNYTPSQPWEKNWDHRDPCCIVEPVKLSSPAEQNRYNSEIEKAKGTAWRHIFLIRHGQYNVNGASDREQKLTDLGRHQAEETGKRLASLGIKFDLLVRSTMMRAQETGGIISEQLDCNIPIHDCQLIEEGAPIPPEPPVGHWKPEPKFFQEGARIEAGFRRYFYRASKEQKDDSFTLLVCHANVIRYFVCK
ncbi:serine/threonine-protein phosphatase Pgam5, mitochondrial isoform X2 [Hyposmocoma kahamanoa]|uniref:serine/threonine-protein phosphatase Pgam5, mitochondrial isoform X2 n=1 Tax=Hyposmocoma kahamanoa TaxID=1477025 RepID=UPI000E6D823F|nr:serine/threonine-protein phosphatase Pgam5, mitochondrial isoform X2 [Hyposmocoma kahamanoa]